MTNHWNVSIWVEGAARPVKTENWHDEASALRRADRLRDEIKRVGWTHKVHVTPVVLQN